MDKYYDNPRIKDYVDKFCVKENKTVEEAMETAMVKNFIQYVKDGKTIPDIEIQFNAKESAI